MKKFLFLSIALLAMPTAQVTARIQQEKTFNGKHAWLQGFKGIPKGTAIGASSIGLGFGTFVGLMALANIERGGTWKDRFVDGALKGGSIGAALGGFFGATCGYAHAYVSSPHYAFNTVKKYVEKIRNRRLYPFMYDQALNPIEFAENHFIRSSYPLASAAAQWGFESAEWQEFHHRLAEIAYQFDSEEDQIEAFELIGISEQFLPILIEVVRSLKADPRFIEQQKLYLETVQAHSAAMTAHAEQMQANAAWLDAINNMMQR